MPLFSFSFEKFFLFKTPWSKQAPGCSHSSAWLSPENPAADPVPQPGFSCPGPGAGPRDLIVLKQSSYRQIFQCPLSLVSVLHICWNTVVCLLCSSDQLGVSLVLRGSGLCFHLSHHHLLGLLFGGCFPPAGYLRVSESPTSCFLFCRCGQVVLELVLLCVKGFVAFLFSCSVVCS